MNPEVTFNIHFIRIDKVCALKVFSQYDIIVDCTDNFASRYLINDACVILNKPLVYGAIHKFSGQLMVLNYQNGPTLRCLYPEPPHPLEVPSCAEAGVIGSIAGIIGSIQATEVIKIITESGEILSGKMFILDSLNYSVEIISIKRDPDSSLIYSLGEYEDACLSDGDQIKEICLKDLREMHSVQPNLKIIDLRDEADTDSLGFECMKIPYYEISQNIQLLTGCDSLVFYCKYGIKSMNVINYLKKYHNMENLYSLVI